MTKRFVSVLMWLQATTGSLQQKRGTGYFFLAYSREKKLPVPFEVEGHIRYFPAKRSPCPCVPVHILYHIGILSQKASIIVHFFKQDDL